jgi:hypothetical protein
MHLKNPISGGHKIRLGCSINLACHGREPHENNPAKMCPAALIGQSQEKPAGFSPYRHLSAAESPALAHHRPAKKFGGEMSFCRSAGHLKYKFLQHPTIFASLCSCSPPICAEGLVKLDHDNLRVKNISLLAFFSANSYSSTVVRF